MDLDLSLSSPLLNKKGTIQYIETVLKTSSDGLNVPTGEYILFMSDLDVKTVLSTCVHVESTWSRRRCKTINRD